MTPARTYRAHAPEDRTRGLLDAMERAGVVPERPIAGELLSGRLVRFRAVGDKPGRRNGWAVLRGAGGAFGHWRLGVSEGWWPERGGRELSRAERAALARELAAGEALRAREREERYGKAQTAALALWRGSPAASDAHPYLVAKRMTAGGLRRDGRSLLVPMKDLATGALWNVQRIGPDGAKRFTPGARVAGLAWGRGEPGPTVALCEGVATAAAVHAATGLCALAAMTKANLGEVALAMRRRWPDARLIVGADRDPDGGGEAAARAAALAAGGLVTLPPEPIGGAGEGLDFADLWERGEAAAIRAAFGMEGRR